MNYQDYIKYDPEKKQYTDSYGYVIDGYSSTAIPNNEQDVAVLANGNVNIKNGLTVGSNLRNQATFGASTGATTLATTGTDTTVNLDLNLKTAAGTESVVRITPSYSNCLALAGGGTPKVTTAYSSGPNANLTLETKGSSSKIILRTTPVNEILEFTQANGSSTFTSTSADIATTPNGDIKFVPRGLGIVDCKSYIAEWSTGMSSTQTLGTNVNTKVWFDNLITSTFPAGFFTVADIGGSTYDTFQNTSGRAIVLMVTACIRETAFPTGRTLGLWIARSGDSTLRYGQALLPPTTDTTNARGLNTASIIRLANNESFSIWAHSAVAGVTIGGSGQLYNRPIVCFKLMP